MFDGLGARAGKPPPQPSETFGQEAYSLPVPDWNASGVYSTELWGNKAVNLIENHNFETTPFFMYLGFQSPHAPVQPSPDAAINARCKTLTQGEGRDVYCSMVSYMDRKIGEVVAAMKRRTYTGADTASKTEWDNTLLIFSSDNGGCFPGENRGCNFPLRGGKHHLFEGGIKVTAFISGGLVPRAARGATSHALMHATDWFTTILGLVDGANIDHSGLDGEMWQMMVLMVRCGR